MSPMDQLRLLMERVTEKADELGLEVLSGAFVPDANLDVLQVMFRINPDAIRTEEEREAAVYDDAFRDMMSDLDAIPTLEEEVGGDAAELARARLAQNTDTTDPDTKARIEEAKRKLSGWLSDTDRTIEQRKEEGKG